MTEDDKHPRSEGRIFDSFEPTCVDITFAESIPANECPRRYCWWWTSLSFEWDTKAAQGCTWLLREKPSHWKFTDIACCRCDPDSKIDHFEPRGLHIETDGIDATKWLDQREKNRQAFLG